jgi:hypothetical protein
MASDDVVLVSRRVNFVQPELKPKTILALQSIEIPIIELAKHENNGRFLLQYNSEPLLKLSVPWHVDTDPFLGYTPIGRVHEKPSSVEVLVLPE